MAQRCPRHRDTCEAAACTPTYCLLEAGGVPEMSPLAQELVEIARAANAVQRAERLLASGPATGYGRAHDAAAKLLNLDPRDPDPSKPGIFRDHNCWKCKDGTLPCAKGHTLNCEFPHARND